VRAARSAKVTSATRLVVSYLPLCQQRLHMGTKFAKWAQKYETDSQNSATHREMLDTLDEVDKQELQELVERVE